MSMCGILRTLFLSVMVPSEKSWFLSAFSFYRPTISSLTKSLPLSHSLPSFLLPFPFLLFLLLLHLSSGSLCSASNRLLHPLHLACYISDDHLKTITTNDVCRSVLLWLCNGIFWSFPALPLFFSAWSPPVSLGARLFLSPSHHY